MNGLKRTGTDHTVTDIKDDKRLLGQILASENLYVRLSKIGSRTERPDINTRILTGN